MPEKKLDAIDWVIRLFWGFVAVGIVANFGIGPPHLDIARVCFLSILAVFALRIWQKISLRTFWIGSITTGSLTVGLGYYYGNPNISAIGFISLAAVLLLFIVSRERFKLIYNRAFPGEED